MFTEKEETRIRHALKSELPGTTVEAETESGEIVEVWFSFNGSLNTKAIKKAKFD